jgi:hypothetical protein
MNFITVNLMEKTQLLEDLLPLPAGIGSLYFLMRLGRDPFIEKAHPRLSFLDSPRTVLGKADHKDGAPNRIVFCPDGAVVQFDQVSRYGKAEA